jgi:hypothetical protein
VNNIKFYNDSNEEVTAELDDNDFQRHSEQVFILFNGEKF